MKHYIIIGTLSVHAQEQISQIVSREGLQILNVDVETSDERLQRLNQINELDLIKHTYREETKKRNKIHPKHQNKNNKYHK